MIPAKLYQKFLLKYKILVSQAQKTVFFVVFFCIFLLVPCSKFVPKSIHQIARLSWKNIKFSSFNSHISPQTPPYPHAPKHAISTDVPPNHLPLPSQMDLRPWIKFSWKSKPKWKLDSRGGSENHSLIILEGCRWCWAITENTHFQHL